MVLTLWVIFTLSFLLMYAVPGGPFDANGESIRRSRRISKRRYHLDENAARSVLAGA